MQVIGIGGPTGLGMIAAIGLGRIVAIIAVANSCLRVIAVGLSQR
jgi:hypothetical protein